MASSLRSCALFPAILVVVVLACSVFGQRTTQPAPVQRPIPDFSSLPDPTLQTNVRYQTYDKTPLKFSVTTMYVLVPVVVTDKSGSPIRGLKKEDFQLQENGKEQKVASLEEIKATAAPVPRPVVTASEISNLGSMDSAPRRLVIIALDMVNTPIMDQPRARQAMITYLSDNVEPGSLYQLVAVENNGVRILHDYTADTGVLIAALKGARSRFPTGNSVGSLNGLSTDPGPTGMNALPTDPDTGRQDSESLLNFMSSHAEAPYSAMRIGDAASSTLLAFQQIAARVSGVPGRKSLIWVTGSFPFSIDPGSASVNEGLSFAAYQHAMQSLSNQMISVYPVDARGLLTLGSDASEHLDLKQNAQAAAMLMDQSNRQLDILQTMRAFADMTGGRAYVNNNDIQGAIRDAVNDGSDYYLLSYPVNKSDLSAGWRKINVKAGDYHVRTRRGYFLTQATLDPLVSARNDIDAALSAPFDYTGLPLRVRLTSPVVSGDKRKIDFAMLMAPKAAKVDSDDKNHLYVDIAYVVRTSTGKEAGHKGISYNLNLNPMQLLQIDTNGVSYGDTLELTPGSYNLCVAVRDNLTGRIGSVLVPLELK